MGSLGIKVGIFFFVLVMYQVFLANANNMLLPSQMVEKYAVGFPLIANGAVWGNALILPVALGLIVAFCGDQWRVEDLLVALLLGTVASIQMTEVYLNGKFPDALAGPNGLSMAGVINAMYTAQAVALIVLFVGSRVPLNILLIVAALCTLYLIVANHVPLDWLQRQIRWVWCPQVFKEESRPLLILFSALGLGNALVALKLIFPGSLLEVIHKYI